MNEDLQWRDEDEVWSLSKKLEELRNRQRQQPQQSHQQDGRGGLGFGVGGGVGSGGSSGSGSDDLRMMESLVRGVRPLWSCLVLVNRESHNGFDEGAGKGNGGANRGMGSGGSKKGKSCICFRWSKWVGREDVVLKAIEKVFNGSHVRGEQRKLVSEASNTRVVDTFVEGCAECEALNYDEYRGNREVIILPNGRIIRSGEEVKSAWTYLSPLGLFSSCWASSSNTRQSSDQRAQQYYLGPQQVLSRAYGSLHQTPWRTRGVGSLRYHEKRKRTPVGAESTFSDFFTSSSYSGSSSDLLRYAANAATVAKTDANVKSVKSSSGGSSSFYPDFSETSSGPTPYPRLQHYKQLTSAHDHSHHEHQPKHHDSSDPNPQNLHLYEEGTDEVVLSKLFSPLSLKYLRRICQSSAMEGVVGGVKIWDVLMGCVAGALRKILLDVDAFEPLLGMQDGGAGCGSSSNNGNGHEDENEGRVVDGKLNALGGWDERSIEMLLGSLRLRAWVSTDLDMGDNDEVASLSPFQSLYHADDRARPELLDQLGSDASECSFCRDHQQLENLRHDIEQSKVISVPLLIAIPDVLQRVRCTRVSTAYLKPVNDFQAAENLKENGRCSDTLVKCFAVCEGQTRGLKVSFFLHAAQSLILIYVFLRLINKV
jgi:hypothetical protein